MLAKWLILQKNIHTKDILTSISKYPERKTDYINLKNKLVKHIFGPLALLSSVG